MAGGRGLRGQRPVRLGKRRLAYERMLGDVRAGMRDAVVVYHLDRLTRRPVELEQFAATLAAAGVTQMRSVVGSLDVAQGDGLFVARVMAAVAAQESDTKSRRIARKHEQLAAAGLPNGGSLRPFAFEPDRVTVREDEARVLREAVARYLAGESLRSLASWLNTERVPTVAGGEWTTVTLRGVLRNPRYAGLRAHRKQVVGPAVWPAVISEDLHRRVLARFAERAVTGRRAPRRYLLSGLLRCGKCGVMLYSSARDRARRYVCLSGPDHHGCGRLTVVAEPLEAFLADAVIYRLDTHELADALAGRAQQDEHAAELARLVAEDREQLLDLARSHGLREINKAEWMTARDITQARLTRNERELQRLTRSDALDGLVGRGKQLRNRWNDLSLDRRHAIVAAVLDHAVINPGTPGARTLDIDRVVPHWRA